MPNRRDCAENKDSSVYGELTSPTVEDLSSLTGPILSHRYDLTVSISTVLAFVDNVVATWYRRY